MSTQIADDVPASWMARESGVFAPYWLGIRAGQLRFPKCAKCGRFQWYPETLCPHCGSGVFDWTQIAPAGHVFSFTVIRRSLLPSFAERVPYVVGVISMDEAPSVRLVTNIIECDPKDVQIGRAVQIVVRETESDGPLPFALLT